MSDCCEQGRTGHVPDVHTVTHALSSTPCPLPQCLKEGAGQPGLSESLLSAWGVGNRGLTRLGSTGPSLTALPSGHSLTTQGAYRTGLASLQRGSSFPVGAHSCGCESGLTLNKAAVCISSVSLIGLELRREEGIYLLSKYLNSALVPGLILRTSPISTHLNLRAALEVASTVTPF